MDQYYIICKRHSHKKDYAVLFWAPNNTGYRYNVSDAGVYTEEEVKKFDKDHYCDDMPVLKSLVDEMAITMVIDNAKLGKVCLNNPNNRKILGIKLSELLSGETAWDKRAFCKPKLFLKLNQNTQKIINEINSLSTI